MSEPPLPRGVSHAIRPARRDIGGFEVGRALPQAQLRAVGPFVFFDRMGPAVFPPGAGIDVRPHPHIGLATVTYLFEGALLHRDSLGSEQVIRPGDVNWMVAGRAVTHSERTPPQERASGGPLSGVQVWIALPEADEEVEASFEHLPAAGLPAIAFPGARVRLILGTAFGHETPVRTFSPVFYYDVEVDAGVALPLPDDHDERAIWLESGEIEIDGTRLTAGALHVIAPGAELSAMAIGPARALVLGGASVGPRRLWWNFVASTPEKIDAAAAAWARVATPGGRFTLPPGDDAEFIAAPAR